MEQQNRLMKRAALFGILFIVAAMSAMLYDSAHKVIVVADVAQDEVDWKTESSRAAVTDKDHIVFDREKGRNTRYFCIPLPADVSAEDVTIENHYVNHELLVCIKPKEGKNQEQFYEDHAVSGNCEKVLDGQLEVEKERISLRFTLTDVYEYQSSYENNVLYIEFMQPKEVYDKIVVIDPAYGGEDDGPAGNGLVSKTIMLNIAKALKTKLDDTDIKVYYTRMDDTNPESTDRVALANATGADMLIRMEVNTAKETQTYGTEAVYNARFFIPGFGNVELADLVEREVVTAIGGKANGLMPAGEEDVILQSATVPAATIRVGYLSNEKERALLSQEEYAKRIAEGIYQAILKAYEEQDKEEK